MIEFYQSEDLTLKEIYILKLFAIEGHERKEVAVILQVSNKTLRGYLSKIYQKLGVKRLHQACACYYIIYCKT